MAKAPEEPLGHRVVVAIASATRRAFDPQRSQGVLVSVARVLAIAIAVMQELSMPQPRDSFACRVAPLTSGVASESLSLEDHHLATSQVHHPRQVNPTVEHRQVGDFGTFLKSHGLPSCSTRSLVHSFFEFIGDTPGTIDRVAPDEFLSYSITDFLCLLRVTSLKLLYPPL